jgi:methylglyoxal synthase
MKIIKNVALVAHDNRKKDLAEWVEWNYQILLQHKLICTGTTGLLIEKVIKEKLVKEGTGEAVETITKLNSGPLGGDQQLGAMITQGAIDVLVFFWDPMEPQPHDVDVKALLRIAVVYNIPIACNRSTADFVISSPLINQPYTIKMKDYSTYLKRNIS